MNRLTVAALASILSLLCANHLEAQTPSVELYGNGCAGAAGVPVLQPDNGSLPYLGQTYTLTAAPIPAVPTPVCLMMSCIRNSTPIDLTGAGMTGCELWINPEVFAGFRAISVFKVTMTLPRHPGFLGMPLQSQLLVIDASRSPVPVIMSNALQSVIGKP